MAWGTPTSISNLQSATDAASYDGSAVAEAPADNDILVLVASWTKATDPDLPTAVTACGKTLTEALTRGYNTGAAPTKRVGIYTVRSTGYDTTAPNMDFGANTQTGMNLRLIKVSGGSSGTPVQTKSGTISTASLSLTFDFDAGVTAGNLVVAVMGHATTAATMTEGASPAYTTLGTRTHNNPNEQHIAQYLIAAGGEVTVVATSDASVQWGGAAIELAVEAGAAVGQSTSNRTTRRRRR